MPERKLPSSSLMSNTERDDRGWTLLHIGARKGDLKLVRKLLDQGMDVNVRTRGNNARGGLTPLHLAAQGGHLRVMEELLQRGADIDARTKGVCGWTPLHSASKSTKNKEAIKFLIKNGAFLPQEIDDYRFNPPLFYCSGLELAYEEMKKLQQENVNLQYNDEDGSFYEWINEGYISQYNQQEKGGCCGDCCGGCCGSCGYGLCCYCNESYFFRPWSK